MRMGVRSLASLCGLRIWRCRELWCRLAAVALNEPLAWEPPYAASAALTALPPPKKKGLRTQLIDEGSAGVKKRETTSFSEVGVERGEWVKTERHVEVRQLS